MDYLDTLQYKNKRVVDSTGYPQNERLFIKSSLSPANVTQSTVIFGDVNGSSPVIYVNDAVSPNAPIIKPVTKGGGNSSLTISGQGAGGVLIDNNKTNYLAVNGSDANGDGVILSANSDDILSSVNFTLKPKGTGVVRTSSSTTTNLEIKDNSITANEPSAPILNLKAKGISSNVLLTNDAGDYLIISPGNGSNQITTLSAQVDGNISLLPQNAGFIKTSKKVQITGSTPNDTTPQLKIENTTSSKTSTILIRANGATPYIALDVQGVVGRSIGMEVDGRINIKDNIIYTGTILFSIMPSGRVYTPNTFQSGFMTVNVATGSVSFPKAFASTPMVVVTISNDSFATNITNVLISNVSTTGFSFEKLYQPIGGGAYGSATSEWLYWTAMINTQ